MWGNVCGEGSMFKISASSFPGSWESPSPRSGEDLRGLLKHIWHSAELAVNTRGNPTPNSILSHPKLSCMSELIGNFMFLEVNSSSSCYNSPNLPAKHWSQILLLTAWRQCRTWHSVLKRYPLRQSSSLGLSKPPKEDSNRKFLGKMT